MTVFVDKVSIYPDEAIKDDHTRRNGYRWSHMWTDGDIEELHKMASAIGLNRQWFQDNPRLPHYDVVPSKRRLALSKGAIEKALKDELRERYGYRKHDQ